VWSITCRMFVSPVEGVSAPLTRAPMRKVFHGLAICTLVACQAGDELPRQVRSELPRVSIAESSAIPTQEFTSAAVINDTSAVTWSEDRPLLTLVSRHGSTALTLSSIVVGAGPGDREGVTELLDRAGRTLVVDERGGVSRGRSIPLDTKPHVAIRIGARWFVVLDEVDGPTLLQINDNSDVPTWAAKLPVSSRVLRASGGRIRLLQNQDGVTVLSSIPPFDVLTYSASGRLMYRMRLADDPVIQRLMREDRRPDVGNWRLVAGVRVDSLELLTLSDLNSDHRVLVLADPRGGIRSSRPLTVPLALIAGNQKWLLAGRRTDRFELVRYSWGWDRLLEEER
jgi:hypothetical protein